MRPDDPAGIIMQADVLSETQLEAWRQQQAKDLAEYRARKMAAYRDWVKPDVIAKRKAEHEAQAAEALARGKAMAEIAKLQQEEAKISRELMKLTIADDRQPAGIKMSAVVKPVDEPKKPSWSERLAAWFEGW